MLSKRMEPERHEKTLTGRGGKKWRKRDDNRLGVIAWV